METSTGLTEVLLDKPLPDRHRVIPDIIASANLTQQVPALLLAPRNARLVVDKRLGKIWFDRVEIADLTLGTHAYRFVEILARNFPGSVNKQDLVAELSGGRTDGDQTARSAKMRANKSIRVALESLGRTFEDPFKSEDGCYRLTVLAYAP